MNDIIPSEDEEQIIVMNWAALARGKFPELDLLFHIPNGGKRGKREAARFKDMGVKAGVPDLFLPVPRGKYAGLFVEMKRTKGGTVSPEQKKWIADLRGMGYAAEVAKGGWAAVELIKAYLGLEDVNGKSE